MEKSLNVTEQLKGKTILLYGGTGFLGKVWMSLVLAHFPDIEHIYMVVRSRKRGWIIRQISTAFLRGSNVWCLIPLSNIPICLHAVSE